MVSRESQDFLLYIARTRRVSRQANRRVLRTEKQRTSFPSVDFTVDPLESSRKRLGVRLIFRVSILSSLKNESVFRRVPFLDRPAALASSIRLGKDNTIGLDLKESYLVARKSRHSCAHSQLYFVDHQ